MTDGISLASGTVAEVWMGLRSSSDFTTARFQAGSGAPVWVGSIPGKGGGSSAEFERFVHLIWFHETTRRKEK
jgi:hypothetical protein